MPGLVEGVPETGEQPSCSAKMKMLPCRSCTPLVGIGLVLDSSRVIFLSPPSPSTAVPRAAGRGEGGGGRAVSVSVEQQSQELCGWVWCSECSWQWAQEGRAALAQLCHPLEQRVPYICTEPPARALGAQCQPESGGEQRTNLTMKAAQRGHCKNPAHAAISWARGRALPS